MIKEEYIQFCKKATHVPIFFQPEWLTIFSSKWQVLKAEQEGIVIYFPYIMEKKLLFKIIRNPYLTPYTGFVANKPFTELNKKIANELCNNILTQLPSTDECYLDFDPSFHLHLKSSEYNISEKITNHLLFNDKLEVYNNFKPSLKRQIKKASKNLTVFSSDDIKAFYNLYQLSLQQRGEECVLPIAILSKVWNMCIVKQCGKLFFITDEQHNTHAALLLVFDSTSAYYLAGATNKNYNGSGAMCLLMWHAIQYAFELGKSIFDFEGSMNANINRFFRTFSPTEKKYIHIEHQKSLLLKGIKKIKK